MVYVGLVVMYGWVFVAVECTLVTLEVAITLTKMGKLCESVGRDY